MKKLILFLFLSTSLFCFGQGKSALKDIQSIKFYGVDYSQVKIFGADESPAQFKDAFRRINELFITEAKKYNVGKQLKKEVTEISLDAVNQVNENIDLAELMTAKREYTLSKEQIKAAINALPIQKTPGVGMVFIAQFLDKSNNRGTYEVVFFNTETKEIIEEWLSKKRGAKVHFKIPVRGQKHKMVEMAKENAQNVLRMDREKIKREERRTIGAVHEIEELLGMEGLNRMEAFDISNISGFQTVASMVVFERGKARRRDYRKFRLRTIEGPDDYASMEEVLTRRFLHGKKELEELKEQGKDAALGSFTKFPDILMMDGGKGQVNVALRVLDHLGLDIPVCGMVKDDDHRTRGLYYNNEEIIFAPNSEAFLLVTRIQDEAHRFAIEYHRSLRAKGQVHSVLDDIKGVGPKRRKELMKYFKDLGQIKTATVTELLNVPGMNQSTAESIYGFFHDSKQ